MSLLSHSWDMSVQDARRLQVKLAPHVIRENRLGSVKTVAGIDVGMKDDLACAAIVVFNFPGLDVVAQSLATRRITFIDVILRCCKGYRLPETTRIAHRLSEECKSTY
jgi:deoxyinosine 3'endonuclease (endonuclease V)